MPFCARRCLVTAVRTALRSSDGLAEVGRFLGAVGDVVIGQRVIGQPEKSGDFAVADLLRQTIALGFGGIGVDLDGINSAAEVLAASRAVVAALRASATAKLLADRRGDLGDRWPR